MIELRHITNDHDEGFTVIELLITLFLFGILTTVLFLVVMNNVSTVTSVRQSTDLNEESRLVLNRMARELREAQAILSVSNPGGSTFDPAADSAVTFEVDFNGNGTIEPLAADPEQITYKFESPAKRILLQAGGQTLPILAENVEFFKLTYTSKKFECDTNSDGTVTWEELDAAPSPCPDNFGNSNGAFDVELAGINSVTIDLTVLTGNRQQDYRTQLDLRNRFI